MDKIQKSKKTFTFVNFMLEYMTVFLNITSKEETKLSSPVDIRENSEEEKEKVSRNFIENIIDKDIEEGRCKKVVTRFPPEPNGYLHIGHAKSIILNSGLAKEYGGQFNLRFDDTNPTKEKSEFVDSILEDVKWICGDLDMEHVFYASDYFDMMYECAIKLIKKGKAYVCDLSPEEIREYRGTLKEPGKNSPYRDRSIEENLDLFERMRAGEFEDGSKVLRAKIDMSSPNINMRDPIIYRIARMHHHNTGDKWCIYPMYDFAHPIEDTVEGVTHSICTLEFEDHRPLYDWVVNEIDMENKPRQIEFAKLYLTNVVTGKRYIKKLVEDGIVDGWDDPRLVSIAALRRRGFTPESIRMFIELSGISKAQSSSDYAMLEYCIREDLKMKKPRMMAVLDPIKLVITNYPENEIEYLDVSNNQENPEMGSRKVPFGRVVEVHCTYDPETKSGSGFNARKVKGTIHWVCAETAEKCEIRLYENIVDEEKGVYNEDGTINVNPNSLTVLKDCYVEPALADAEANDSFQFVRHGYFCVDSKDSEKGNMVFNRIVSLKSSYRPK